MVALVRSASVLPGVDEDARVEHGIDIGAERILLLEVSFVDRPGPVNAAKSD